MAAPEYSLQTQAKISLALGSLHNFIHINDPDDDAFHEDDNEDDGGVAGSMIYSSVIDEVVTSRDVG